jgi:hypothetical protein
MNPHLTEQLVSQHETDLRTLRAHEGQAQQARQGRRVTRALEHNGHRHAMRRRAGWALVSLGMRVACTADEK